MIGQNLSTELTHKVKFPVDHPRIIELLNIIRTEFEIRDGSMYVLPHKGESTEYIIGNILNRVNNS